MADRPIIDGRGTVPALNATSGQIDVFFDPLLTPLSSPSEGQIDWDPVCHTMTIPSDIPGVAIAAGHEDQNRVYNDTGSIIPNGTPLYKTSGMTNAIPHVAPADADATGANVNKRAAYALATHDIGIASEGVATPRGFTKDIDNTVYGFSEGDELWLSDVEGELANEAPLSPASRIRMGLVTTATASLFTIEVDVNDLSWVGATQSANQATERTGFILNNNRVAVDTAGGAITHSTDTGTLTYSVSGASGAFPIFSQDNLFIKAGSQDKVWSDVEGGHYFYFDELGELQHSVSFDTKMILGPWVFSAYLQWDATNKEIILDEVLIENHGIQMDGATHLHLHNRLGAGAESGLTLGDIISDGNGTLDTHAQFSVASGSVSDEDLLHTIAGVASTVGTRVLGLEGSGADTRQYTKAGFSVLTDNDVTTKAGTSTGRLVYNYFDGVDWVYDAVGVNDYVLCHTFAIGIESGGEDLYSAVGQVAYASSSGAEAGAISEINDLIQTLPFQEVRPISSVILQTGSYGNAVNARIRPTLDGADYVDHRTSGVTGGSGLSTTDHSSLSNRDAYGSHPANAVRYMPPTILTISTGAVTYTQPTHTIAAETGTTDDLDTISVGTSDSYRLAIQADTGDTITIKHGTGNISTNDGSDFELSGDKVADMVYDGGGWVVVNVGDAGSSNTEQSVAYGATINIDLSSGNVIKVGDLTGNITVNNPTNATTAEEVYIRFTQDSTGGRAITLGTDYVLLDDNANYPTGASEVFFFSGITQSDGTIEGGYSPLTSLTVAEPSNPNILINADGTDPIDQRGVDGTTVSAPDYAFDRWLNNGIACTWEVQSDGGIRATATASGTIFMVQKVEGYANYSGTAVTFSASVRSDIACNLALYDGATVFSSSIHPGDGQFHPLTLNATLGTATELQVYLTGVAVSTDYIEFEWIKLEPGSVATPFVADKDSGTTLRECLPYYERVNAIGLTAQFGTGSAVSTTNALIFMPHARKRSGAWTVGNSGSFELLTGGTATAVTSITINDRSENGTSLSVNTASGLVVDKPYTLRASADATAYLELKDEL